MMEYFNGLMAQAVLIFGVLFLGLDHTRAMVYEHCKKLLENLILLASTQEGQNIARMLLEYRSNISDTLKLIAEDREGPGAFGKFYTVVSLIFVGITFHGYCFKNTYIGGYVKSSALPINCCQSYYLLQ